MLNLHQALALLPGATLVGDGDVFIERVVFEKTPKAP